MRVLITGGCGFLGAHLVEHFLKSGEAVEIVVLDKHTYASSGQDRLRDVGGGSLPKDVHVLGCDLGLPVPDGIIQEIGQIDYIIHAAAESHVDRSITDPLPFLQSNVIGTHNLLMMARGMNGLRRVFCVSTDEVYGPAGPPNTDLCSGCQVPGAIHTLECVRARAFDENAPFRPANPYAAAKAGGECVAMAYANTYGLPITIVNTMNLIGERQHPEKFVPLVIRKVMRGEPVTIHADQTKRRAGSRFYLHARTFAHALGFLIDADRSGVIRRDGRAALAKLPLKIHVCGEREISNLELATRIAAMLSRHLEYELVDFHSSRPGHDLRYAMDDSLIRDMGWVRPMGLEQSLAKTVQWYLNNPRWLEQK